MKTIRQLVLVLTGVLALSAGAETNAVKTVMFKGTVVDAAGRPVAGATIETYTYDGGIRFGRGDLDLSERAVADAKGAFEVPLPCAGVMILARKPGLAPAWRQFHNLKSDVEQRLVLTPPAILAGVVVDEADKPVGGAEVFVLTAFSEMPQEGGAQAFNYITGKPARELFNTRAGPDGRFRIEGFPTNASANLLVQSPGKSLREWPQSSFGPDSMQWRAGDEDIRLVVEPAGSIEGKIMAEGAAKPLPTAALVLQPDGPGFLGTAAREPAESAADGTFRIADVGAGNYRIRAVFGTNATPDWVAEAVPVSVEIGQATRNVEISATRGGLLKVTVLGQTDHAPRSQVSVNAYRQNYQTDAVSDNDGTVLLRLPPGEYRVNAYRAGMRSEQSAATVEAGKTNLLEIELPDPVKIAGAVRGPDGQPAAGLEVRIVGAYSPGGDSVKTDAKGKFEMEWNPRQYGRADMTYCLLIRDPERNLAVVQDIDEDTGPLDLQLAPAMTIVGRAECDGKPVTNVSATLIFWSGSSGMHLTGLCVGTNVPGRFEIPALPPGRRYGLYVSAPGFGQKSVSTVESDEAKRLEIDPVELKPANLKLAGQVLDVDDKPVSNAYVHLYGDDQPRGNTRTDRDGRFRFDRVCEGMVRLSANARNSHGSVSAEGGDTNVVLRLGETYSGSSGAARRKLSGVVTDPDGKPAAGTQVTVFPFSNSRWVKTGTNGVFNLSYAVQEWQLQSGGDPWLVARDTARNLAVAEVILEGVTNLNAQLRRALTLTGRVEGPDGAPLTDARVGVWLNACRTYSQLEQQLTSTDARGGFEIKAVPPGPKYIVFAKAKDHGQKREEIEPDATTNRVTLATFVLDVADQVVAGQVVNSNDKPISGVHVSLSGEGQPDGSMTTDSKGRFKFKVCEGEIRLHASGQSGYANALVTAGDTNVVIQLTRSGSYGEAAPKRASLKGKPLPELGSVGLAADAAPTGKPLLLCLLDVEQRPSRHVARRLAQQHDALRQKGVTVAVIQVRTSTLTETFQEWTNSTPMPFPVGCVAENTAANKWATSVTSLPWLILRDAKGTVAAEGFALDELEGKIGALNK